MPVPLNPKVKRIWTANQTAYPTLAITTTEPTDGIVQITRGRNLMIIPYLTGVNNVTAQLKIVRWERNGDPPDNRAGFSQFIPCQGTIFELTAANATGVANTTLPTTNPNYLDAWILATERPCDTIAYVSGDLNYSIASNADDVPGQIFINTLDCWAIGVYLTVAGHTATNGNALWRQYDRGVVLGS